MKTTKRIVALILTFCLIFVLAACSSDNNTDDESGIDISLRPYYKPTCVTVSFYDTAKSSYGFTWNTEYEPMEAVLQISEGDKLDDKDFVEIPANVEIESTYMPSATSIYVCKVEIPLKPETTYTYRAFDKGAKVASNAATFHTADFEAEEFNFVHISDSQTAEEEEDGNYYAIGTGDCFAETLSGIIENKPSFLLHTGDIVEYSKYEPYWRNMLDYNGKIIRTLPFMPLSGNHETTYRAGENEIFKHFNIAMPEQGTETGFYYSFDCGNVKFIMLNTNNQEATGLSAEQYSWLVDTLKNNTKKWTIVSMHHPMYSVGKWGANPEQNSYSLALRQQLTKLFADYKVDLVLQGHDHTYSKTYPIKGDGTADRSSVYENANDVKYAVNPNGVIYAMHGAAGNQNRSPYGVDYNIFEIAEESKTNSWADIKLENDKLTVEIMCRENERNVLLYSYGIIKKQ